MIIPITNELLVAGDKEIAVLEEKVSKQFDIIFDSIINGEGTNEPTGLYPRSK